MVDHGKHKAACKDIRKLLDKVTLEESLLRKKSGEFFVHHIGDFWAFQETRDYMGAKQEYFLFLSCCLDFEKPAVHEAIVQGKDMLRLCRKDNLAVRQDLPGLFLLLGTYDAMQECYEFVKCWVKYEPDKKTLQSPFDLTRGADMCEPVWTEMADIYGMMMVAFPVAVTVIKMRLFLHLRSFQTHIMTMLIATTQHHSFMSHFRSNECVLRSVAAFLLPGYPCFRVPSRKNVSLRALQTRLHAQVQEMITLVERYNSRIWKIFVNPLKALQCSLPRYFICGSAEEAILMTKLFLFMFVPPCKGAREMRQLLVDRVGEKPDYDLTSSVPEWVRGMV